MLLQLQATLKQDHCQKDVKWAFYSEVLKEKDLSVY